MISKRLKSLAQYVNHDDVLIDIGTDHALLAIYLIKNKILTKNVKIGLNGRKHRRNLNVLVCGGSGAGKTRFYCKPNIMQANTSFVILDPKRRNTS